jgi:hypothetical protein
VRFKELAKTPEQLHAKFTRDVRALRESILSDPMSARWRYYLGESFAGLGDVDQALESFQICASMHGWDEEGAWAAYRAADLQCRAGRYTDAVQTCANGLARHAGMCELANIGCRAACRYEQACSGRPCCDTGAWSGIKLDGSASARRVEPYDVSSTPTDTRQEISREHLRDR